MVNTRSKRRRVSTTEQKQEGTRQQPKRARRDGTLQQTFGIPNVGNSCYINCVIMLLTSLTSFTLVDLQPFKEYIQGILKKRMTITQTKALKEKLCKGKSFRRFCDSGMEDAQEFLMAILNSRGFQTVKQQTTVKIQSVSKCRRCSFENNAVVEEVQIFQINRMKDFQQAVRDSLHPTENIVLACGHNNCKGKQALRTNVVITSPQYLILATRLFNQRSGMVQVKLSGMNTPTEIQFGDVGYELLGSIRHIGKNSTRGHYVTYLYNQNSFTLFDDDKVVKGHSSTSLIGDNYISIFKRKDA